MRDNRRRSRRSTDGASLIIGSLVASAWILLALQPWAMGMAAPVEPVMGVARHTVSELQIHVASGATTSDCGSNDCATPAHADANHESGLSEREGDDLLAWAAAQSGSESSGARPRAHDVPDISTRLPEHTRLLIGVKIAAIQGFAARQLLRQSWADPTRLPHGVSVVFLGCEPPPSASTSSHEELQWRVALQMEKATYKDLLTSELGCYDSYFTLVDKIKGFFRWTAAAVASRSLDHLAFVMLVDDDVYVRVDELVQSLEPLMDSTAKPSRYYAGEVMNTQFRVTYLMDRDPKHKNTVPYAEYPMRAKPPFATGPHYVLSLDLVQFMARNDRFLKGVGTLEDVSVAYWVQALLGVQPVHLPKFDNVHYTLCHSALLAYADLTHHAIRQMHANERGNRSLCHGFSFSKWDKRVSRASFPKVSALEPQRILQQLQYNWDLQYNSSTRALRIVTKASSEANESVAVVYSPAETGFSYFCEQLVLRVLHAMPTTAVRVSFCDDHQKALQAVLLKVIRDRPASAHLIALPRSNLNHGTNSAQILVRLSQSVVPWRTLVECLLAAAFPDAMVSVRGEDDYAESLGDYPPHIVFATTEDIREQLARTEASSWLPPLVRLVLLAPRGEPIQLPPAFSRIQARAVLISASIQEHFHRSGRQLILPVASSSFAHRRQHSPRALLRPVLPDAVSWTADVGNLCGGAGSSREQRNSDLANALDTLGFTIDRRCTTKLPVTAPVFGLGDEVERSRQYKFAVVFEDHPDTPGYIGHQIVSAFLAGSIPIYYGHSPSVSWLFNPKAFIDCRAFDSMNDCAAHAAHVHASAELYDVMRREPPVVNHTAFLEVFSWHPDATTTMDGEQEHTMGKRFKEMLMKV